MTDHRLSGEGRSFNIASIMDGDLDALIDALVTADQAARLAEQNETGLPPGGKVSRAWP